MLSIVTHITVFALECFEDWFSSLERLTGVWAVLQPALQMSRVDLHHGRIGG